VNHLKEETMATPQAKLEVPKPKAKKQRAVHLPIRVPARLRDHFFLVLDGEVSDQEFDKLVQLNSELWFERTAKGEVEIMPPLKGETGEKNGRIIAQLIIWADDNGTGVSFGPTMGFKLPNGATRAPDASWVERSRLATLTPKQKKEYFPLCPDFVLELRSATDRISRLKEKMEEYLANGAKLGWLIDPVERKVYVYRPGSEVEVLDNPLTIAGDPVLPGFTLKLEKIWEADF
jgi:Uma2 family endonuclease